MKGNDKENRREMMIKNEGKWWQKIKRNDDKKWREMIKKIEGKWW
jgi:hypothetical protein